MSASAAESVPRRVARVLRNEGAVGVWDRLWWRARTRNPLRSYARWLDRYARVDDELRWAIREQTATLPYRPLLSIVMPTYNSPERWLRRALDSVLAQHYPHWELCVADDASTLLHVREVLQEYAARDPRVRLAFRERQGHISAASNSALALATGEFVALLDHDDELAEHALFLVAKYLNERPDADLLYSDEDKITEAGVRFDAYFKPDWNPDLLLSHNCFSHLGIYRTALLRRIGGFREGLEGSQDWDLALRAAAASAPERIVHIPHVLYHWRVVSGSAATGASAKPYAVDAAHRAIEDHLAARGVAAGVEQVTVGAASLFRVAYRLPEPEPRVLLVIAARGGAGRLHATLTGVRDGTHYGAVDLVVALPAAASGPERETLAAAARAAGVPAWEGPDDAAAFTAWLLGRGEHGVIVFLDARLAPSSPAWLTELVAQATRPEVGAVGARLSHPDGAVHHAGLVIGLEGGVDYAHQGRSMLGAGYAGRANLVQNVSAVCGLCLAVSRGALVQAGGVAPDLDEGLGDVDLGLRLLQAGRRNVYTPYAQLRVTDPRLRRAPSEAVRAGRADKVRALLRACFGVDSWADPAYSVQLDQRRASFLLGWPPRLPLAEDILRPVQGARPP